MDEIKARAAEEEESALIAAEDALEEDDEYEDDEDECDDVPEEPIDPNHDPLDDKVAGMSRQRFYGVLFGFGAGVVLAGLVGILFGIEVRSSTRYGIAGGIVGYFAAGQMEKRRHAKRDAEEHQQ